MSTIDPVADPAADAAVRGDDFRGHAGGPSIGRPAEFDQVALQVVFAVFGRVEDALFGDDAAQAGHGAVADFYGFQAEVVQFFGDGGVVGVGDGIGSGTCRPVSEELTA